MPVQPVPAAFFARDTVRVARDLLGCLLETRVNGGRAAGRIVECEAYVGPDDPAAHGYGNRRTRRNDALFGPPGTCYVYFIYGNHWCFNTVTEQDGFPSAVLIRALEPVYGLPLMKRRRHTSNARLLCSGPGRLCAALGIDGRLNARPLGGAAVRIFKPAGARKRIAASPRIGVSRAADWPLRFYLADSPWVSRRETGKRKGGRVSRLTPPPFR